MKSVVHGKIIKQGIKSFLEATAWVTNITVQNPSEIGMYEITGVEGDYRIIRRDTKRTLSRYVN